MKSAATMIGVLGLAVLGAASTPYYEARDLYLSGTKLGVGVAAYGEGEDGNHWFYSHAVIQGGLVGTKRIGECETTIRSWSDHDGAPLKAIYWARSAGITTTTTVTVEGEVVRMEEVTERDNGGKSTKSASFEIPKGTSVQMSQFNPLDIHMPSGSDSTALLIVEPVTLSAEQANLRLVASGTRLVNGRPVGKENRYVLETGAGKSVIRVDGDGRLIWTVNSEGMEMIPAKVSSGQMQELSEAASRMAA